MELQPVLYSALAGGASLAGILLVLRWREWAIRRSHLINSLAAGVLLGVAFLSLLPEASELSSSALVFALAGFIVFYVLETLLVFHSGTTIHFEAPAGTERMSATADSGKAMVIFAGLFLHSLIDGIVILIGFAVSREVGILAAASVLLHELPEGVTTFALLVHRVRYKTAIFLSIAVALATPAGAILGWLAIPQAQPSLRGALLAGAAGTFLYIGASDLVPETHTRKGWVNALFLVGGVCIAYLLSTLLHHY